jgi:ankyrin repeat protein
MSLVIHNDEWYTNNTLLGLNFIHDILETGIKVTIKNINSDYNGILTVTFEFYKNHISVLHKLLIDNIKFNIDIDINSQEFIEFNLEFALNNKIDDLLVYLVTTYKEINVDYSNFEGNTPLIIATENDNFDLVSELLNRNCSIDKKNNYGNTALIEACLTSNYFLIHKLIDSGADINTKNITNWTPLMFASANKFDDTNIIEYLVSKGGICDMKTTIQMAKSIGNTNISDYFEKIEKNTL